MAKTRENDVLVIKDDGYIYYSDRKGLKFHRLNAKRLAFEDIQYICVDSANVLWIFSSSGDVRSCVIEKKEDSIPELFFSRCLSRRESCFGHQEKEIWFILLTVLMIFMSMICVAGINIS